MTKSKEDILQRLSLAVLNMDEAGTVVIAKEAIEAKIDAYEAIQGGLVNGMNKAGELYEKEEYFVPELLLCSDAMNVGIEILKPYLKRQETKQKVKVVLGVVEGDTHDIGKNLVKIMMEANDFEVYDLGRNVPAKGFVEKALEIKADIIGLSTMMTTTMDEFGKVIGILGNKGVRNNFRIIIGGGPISVGFANRIGADGYGINATDAVRVIKKLKS